MGVWIGAGKGSLGLVGRDTELGEWETKVGDGKERDDKVGLVVPRKSCYCLPGQICASGSGLYADGKVRYQFHTLPATAVGAMTTIPDTVTPLS